MGVVELKLPSSLCALTVSVSFSHNSLHVVEVSQSFSSTSTSPVSPQRWRVIHRFFSSVYSLSGFQRVRRRTKMYMYMFVRDIWSVCGRLVVTSVRPCTRNFVGCWNEKYSFCTFLDRVQLFLHILQVRRRRTEGRKNQEKSPLH